MKHLKITFVVVLLTSFLGSASGILMFYARCACTGEFTTAIYSVPERCTGCSEMHSSCEVPLKENDLITDVHHGSCCGNSSDSGCENETDCACDQPEPHLYRIDDSLSVSETKVSNYLIWRLMATVMAVISEEVASDVSNKYFAYDPPPLISGGSDFIYFICQSKIPSIA